MKKNLVDIGRAKGTEQERALLLQVAKAAGITVSALLRRSVGLEPLPRGTPKRKPEGGTE